MRRLETQLEVSNVAWLAADGRPRQPTLTIRASGDVDALVDRLPRRGSGSYSGEDFDVTFRLHGSADSVNDGGVLAISKRVTGEFLLETNAPVSGLAEFVTAVRRYAEQTDGAACYRTRVVVEEDPIVDFEKRTLLVYSVGGELLRQQSLIPSGVEL